MKDASVELVEAFIWHDREGNILAVGHAIGSDATIEPVAQPGDGVIRSRLPLDVLSSLHETHSVDPEKGELQRREAPLATD
jgi:hypothetical protein